MKWWPLISGFVLVQGCGSTQPPLTPVPPPPLGHTTVTYECEQHPGHKIQVQALEFPDDVLFMKADSTFSVAATVYKAKGKRSGLVVTSLADGSVLHSSLIPVASAVYDVRLSTVALQQSEKKPRFIVYDFRAGKKVAERLGFFRHEPIGREVLRFERDSLAVHSEADGELLWRRAHRLDASPILSYMKIGPRFFVTNGGLMCADAESGEGWSYTTRTWHKSHLKQAGLMVLQALAGALTGTYAGATPEADVTAGLFSNPLTTDGKVYFASKDSVVALSLDRGEVLWRRAMDARAGTSWLSLLDDSTAIFVSFGTDVKNGALRETQESYVSCLELASGEEIWRFEPPERGSGRRTRSIRGAAIWRDCCVVMTGSEVYALDRDGVAKVQRRIPEQVDPQDFVIRDPWIVIRGGGGIASFHLDDPAQSWLQVNKNITTALTRDRTAHPYHVIGGHDPYKSASMECDPRHIWLYEYEKKKGKLCAYDVQTGSCVHRFSIKNASLRVEHDRLLLIDGKRMAVLPVAALLGESP